MRARRRNALLGMLGLAAVLAGAGGFGFHRLSDRCGTDEVLATLGHLIPKDADKDGVVISNARLEPGQLLAFPFVCDAETQPLRLDQRPGSGEAWQELRYRVAAHGGQHDVVLLDPR
jgi:hypothetical protein